MGGRKIGGGNKKNVEKVIFYFFRDAIIQAYGIAHNLHHGAHIYI